MLHANKALTSLSNYKCIIDCCNIHVRRYNFASSASSFCVRTWQFMRINCWPMCFIQSLKKLMYSPSSLVSLIHFLRPACNLSLKIGIFRDLNSNISWRIKPKISIRYGDCISLLNGIHSPFVAFHETKSSWRAVNAYWTPSMWPFFPVAARNTMSGDSLPGSGGALTFMKRPYKAGLTQIIFANFSGQWKQRPSYHCSSL